MPMHGTNSDLGTPLTTPDLDDDECGGDGGNPSSASITTSSIIDGNIGGDDIINSPPRGSPTSNNTKSYISEDDPFYMFRSDLVRKLHDANIELEAYQDIVRNTDTSVNTHECRESKRRLKRLIKMAEMTSNDLETTVRVVERGRGKFPHITDVEILDRREFVDDSKDGLADIKLKMQSEWIRDKYMSDERAMLERRRGGEEWTESRTAIRRPQPRRGGGTVARTM